ncbi:MAG: molybdopterin-dependent oxidoreductase [Chloroflexi bacterium]|nr:molybdopterin-dependent oxidoreductase [Chloroflexota bacterium]
MEITRRDLLKTSAFLGGTALFAEFIQPVLQARNWVAGAAPLSDNAYPFFRPETMIYSACQQCNTQCGIKARILDGVVVKIDGNPYNPFNLLPHIDYKMPAAAAATTDAPLCPKGQAGIQSTYDPYRIVKVLKRAGKRGENKWRTVPFDHAITEIVNGGKLFADVPGEENRVVTGLAEIYALRDAKVMADMAAEVKVIQSKKTPEDRKAAVQAFKTRFSAHLDKLIDPEHPDFGPKNNELSFMWGRLKSGRSDFITRFTKDGLGSTNAHGHTTVCQGSLYFSGKAMSEQFVAGKFSGGDKFYWQADLENAEFVIFVGASPFEGNYGPTNRVPRIVNGISSGRLKYVVVDPRLSKLASKAAKWLPIRPGTEAAMALALIRWVIENKRYDARFLANANKAAAAADKEASWCNASWLVKLTDGKTGDFLRASEIGLTRKESKKDKDGKDITVFTIAGKEYAYDLLVCLKEGRPVAFDPNDDKNAVEGDLMVDTRVDGVAVKSSMQLLWESASSKKFEEWASICDIRPSDLEDVAVEFTSHGKKAAADLHRGASQHTNGFYNVISWFNLNLLIGNFDWKGGMVKLSTYDILGGKAGKPFDLGKMNPGKLGPFGISIIRHDVKYEDTTIFDEYPARRNWWPLSSDIYQEQIPSMGDMYPYQIKALFIYMGSPVYSLPAGNTNIDILADPDKIPLVVASDILVGETSMYADYIFPDLTNLERWEFVGSHPSMTTKVSPIRQPVIGPLVEMVKVYGKEMPISLESMLLALAEKLNLPNFGPDGFGKGVALTHQDDLYLRMSANIAFGEKADGTDAVPDASDEEVKLFLDSRRHLPASVFDPDRWKAIAGEANWRKVIFLLNRGGRFQEYAKIFDGERVANRYGKLINMYQEKTAGVKNAFTGKPLAAIPTYFPAPLDVLGNPLPDEAYDLNLITFREISQTKSRTISNYWLGSLLPENSILMNKRDADRLRLKDGEPVRVVSASNTTGEWDLKNGQRVPIVGKLRVIQGIRPGVVAFSLGHGHFAYGGVDITVDGQTIKGDARRVKGVHANAAMRIDPYLKNTCLMDPVGGSAVFYDTRVKVVSA